MKTQSWTSWWWWSEIVLITIIGITFPSSGDSPAEQQGSEDNPECIGKAGSRELSSNQSKYLRISIYKKTYRTILQENVKHFIPHHAITCAVQGSSPNEDVVSTILLIYNPATACPVHVHSYRCDSPETAQLLQEQLQVESSRAHVDVNKSSRCWSIGLRTRKSSLRLSLGCRRKVSSSATAPPQAAQSLDPMVGRLAAAQTRELARTRAASWTPARRLPQCRTTLVSPQESILSLFPQVRQPGSRAERKAWCSPAAAASPARLWHNASKPWQRCRQRGEEESEPSGGRHDCRRRPRSWQQREEQRDRKRGGRDRQRRQLESSRWRRVPARPRRSVQFRYFFF